MSERVEDGLAGTPFWRSLKAESLDALELAPGKRALDVGCGVGTEVRAIAARVAPGGATVGVDASEELLAVARSRLAAGGDDGAVELLAARAEELPFADASFDAVRCERALQHVAAADAAVAETVRVARPGGTVCLVEPDWETLVFAVDPTAAGGDIAGVFMTSVPQPRIGRELAGHLHALGLRGVTVRARTAVMPTLTYADQQLDLTATLEAAAADGTLDHELVDAWLAEARARDADGRFLASLTFFIASGRVAPR